MIKAGIVGGAGYTAGELIRLINNHAKVTLDFVYSIVIFTKKLLKELDNKSEFLFYK